MVAAAVTGGTIAFYADTETSAGNIFTAGSIDLKVDHTKQTYNGVDCHTCDVDIWSDANTQVVATVGGDDPVAFPHNAALVSNPHPAWTATGTLGPEAVWVWATDPTLGTDTTDNASYTFERTFEWLGPIAGVTLDLGVGADNSYEVYLNGNLVGADPTENNFATADTYNGFEAFMVQGTNTLQFKVVNKAGSSNPANNPAGLLYRLHIDGNCGESYFLNYCQLFGERDLGEGDHFWLFDDIKPGDQGTNVISLHVETNDAYVCLLNNNVEDLENVIIETEADAGDITDPLGELSQYLGLFIWNDLNQDGLYQPNTEDDLYEGDFIPTEMLQLSLSAGGVDFLGVAWCVGDQTVNHATGDIACDGNGAQNDAQTDSVVADLVAYAVQQRNNDSFSCADVVLPGQEPQTQPLSP